MYALRRCMFGFHSWATVTFQELIFRTELISDTRSVRIVDDHTFLLLQGIVGSTLMYSGLLNRPLTFSVQACFSTCLVYPEEPADRQLFTSSCCTKYVAKIGLWLCPVSLIKHQKLGSEAQVTFWNVKAPKVPYPGNHRCLCFRTTSRASYRRVATC
jgi:hypothetical protein